jgi:predicted ATPase/class 3 adenylate cyclase
MSRRPLDPAPDTAPRRPPDGTVTFLFSDIEGSTKLLQEVGHGFGALLEQHHRLLRDVFSTRAGHEVFTEGDAFFVVFPSASAAIGAALAAQRALTAADWGADVEVKVRMGLHTGEAKLVGDNYGGLDVHRAARIASAAHGGQVLVSDTTRAVAEAGLEEVVAFRDLGEHRLKDLDSPVRLFQLCVEDLPADFAPPRSLDARPNNLPTQLSAFIAREHEVAEIRTLLMEHRLVTLTGPGGTGKTRLSLEVAARAMPDFTDGTFVVALARITDPDFVAPAIAETLGVREQGTRPVADTLRSSLAEKEMLVVLDNFEQILEAAPLVSDLLAAAPRLSTIVTSRAPLRIYGEQEYPVPPMATPDPQHLPPFEVLLATEAIMLFEQRARSVQPSFALTPENAFIVAQICARLDGLPLAIELAAARTRIFSPHDILDRLQKSLSVLGGRARDVPQRQQTLRDAVSWSYDLLDLPLQAFFRRLGVFVGGWTFDAADAVVDPSGELQLDTLDALEMLVDHSLIRRYESETDSTRFRMLQTIREYALERLDEAVEADEVGERHLSFFVQLAEDAENDLTTRLDLLEQLSEDHDNMRAALRRSIDSGRSAEGMRLAAAIWRFWQLKGHLIEGRKWLVELLKSDETQAPLRAKALTALGSIAYWQNDMAACAPYYAEALELQRALGDERGLADAIYNSAFVSLIARDLDRAKELYEESREMFEVLNDDRGIGSTSWGLAMVAVTGGALDEAQRLADEANEHFARAEDWFGQTLAKYVHYQVARLRGDLDLARRLVLEELAAFEAASDPVAIASFLDQVADVEISTGHAARALRLGGAAEALKEVGGGEVPPALLLRPGDPRELARQWLSNAEIESAWEEGRAMSLGEALAYARKEPAS